MSTKTLKVVTPGVPAIVKESSLGHTVLDSFTLISGVASATPGTRTSHAHGLAYTPTVAIIIPVAADDNNDNAKVVSLVSIDATNVVVKSSTASIAFKALVI